MEGLQKLGWSITPPDQHHPIATEAQHAWQRIHTAIIHTPLTAVHLTPPLAGRVHVKREDMQHTGSFKARGAINTLLAMANAAQLTQGVVTSSTGNHALGCVYAFDLVRHSVDNRVGDLDVWVPTTTACAKLDRLRSLGATVILHGQYVTPRLHMSMHSIRHRQRCTAMRASMHHMYTFV